MIQNEYFQPINQVRGNAIGRLVNILEREKENLARIITREIGKTLKEARGEVQEAIDTAQFFQSELAKRR